jgi:hypothetical protein
VGQGHQNGYEPSIPRLDVRCAVRAPIWKAARATSAAPTFFVPIDIDGIEYGDAGIGYNNPVKEALAELHNMWPDRRIGCLLSVGTGLEKALQRPDESECANLGLLLKRTSPKTTIPVSRGRILC